jgi:hypothetical protein
MLSLTLLWASCSGHIDAAPLLDCTTILEPLAANSIQSLLLEAVVKFRATRHLYGNAMMCLKVLRRVGIFS